MLCGCDNIDWSGTGSMISAVVSFFAFVIGIVQLRKIKESLIDSNIMKILEIEFELNRLKERASDSRKELLQNTSLKEQSSYTEEEQYEFDIYYSFYIATYENYLNCLERLCRFIIIKKISENDFKDDYKPYLTSVVNDENFEKIKDKFPNIVSLNKKWS